MVAPDNQNIYPSLYIIRYNKLPVFCIVTANAVIVMVLLILNKTAILIGRKAFQYVCGKNIAALLFSFRKTIVNMLW